MDRIYTAEATATGARTGEVASSDGRLAAQLSRPAEMGGDGGPGTNPEQLFAAGYAACFHSAMRFALKDLGLTTKALEDSSVTARVHFLRGEPGDFGLAVDLSARLPQLDEEQARKLLEKTHTICPYSRATAGNVEVGLHVVPPASAA
ncbi:MAG: organic hydroperoxide resistance protein [Actinomycetota bacterium]|nr:organic hydroperoxide resistance protein [Actinomycetota bacterium]